MKNSSKHGGARPGAGRPAIGTIPTASLTARHDLLMDLLSKGGGGVATRARESNRRLIMAAIVLGGTTATIARSLDVTEGALLNSFGPDIADALRVAAKSA